MSELFAGYVPVIDAGYLSAFERHTGSTIGVFDATVLESIDYTRKEIRALSPDTAAQILKGLGFNAVTLSQLELTTHLQTSDASIHLIDDDISHKVVDLSQPIQATMTFEPVFLRWDRNNIATNQEVQVDRVIEVDDTTMPIIEALYEEAAKSSDWWRHVSAAIVGDDGIIASHNRALPSDYMPSFEGDPRILAKRGEAIEKSLFIHAEADLIATMAREGHATQGREIYVSTFPCPNCAKLIASAGFKTVYFIEGYAMADGQRVLSEMGVEIVKIITKELSTSDSRRLRVYPEKPSNG